jgi:hypothetical protein
VVVVVLPVPQPGLADLAAAALAPVVLGMVGLADLAVAAVAVKALVMVVLAALVPVVALPVIQLRWAGVAD